MGEITPNNKKYFLKSIDMMGREINPKSTGFRIDLYSDGTTKKVFVQE
jgi:hypothetical protein